MIDFSGRVGLESAVFIKWTVPGFDTAYVSDYHTPITFGGNTYVNAGSLLSVTAILNELKASRSELSITLSGIPTGSIATVLNQNIRGSSMEIYRGFFEPSTHVLLDLTPNSNPLLKFKGIVTNYAVTDIVDPSTLTASTTIVLTCNSIVEILSSKTNGRRTNPSDFPNNSNMIRVSALANSNYQFGAPQ